MERSSFSLKKANWRFATWARNHRYLSRLLYIDAVTIMWPPKMSSWSSAS